MLYEQAHCKKEKEQRRNLKHEINGNCKLTHLVDSSKSVQDIGNVKCVENGDHLVAGRSSSHKAKEGSIIWRNSKSSASPSSSSKHSKPSSKKRKGSAANDSKNYRDDITTVRTKCYDQPAARKKEPCATGFKWQHAEYVRDKCGSGIQPLKRAFGPNRKVWCSTPLSMYQSTIGELARKILCNEFKLQRNVNEPPPCNVCEYALPLCHGYYRKYDCIRSCEEDYARHKNGRKIYRDRVQRYWEPCLTDEQKPEKGVRHYAPHNAYLGEVLRRKFKGSVPCW